VENISVEEIEWHDAELNEIKIESLKDAYDSIKIILSSNNFIEGYNSKKITIILQEVFKAKFEVNMWITGNDVISNVSVKNDSEWLRQVSENKKGNFGPKTMKHLIIRTNTDSCFEFLITKDLILEY